MSTLTRGTPGREEHPEPAVTVAQGAPPPVDDTPAAPAGPAGHVPTLVPLNDGVWAVVCHACTETHGQHTYPCNQPLTDTWTAPPPPYVRLTAVWPAHLPAPHRPRVGGPRP